MTNNVNAGIIIGCHNSHEFVKTSTANPHEIYNWKKIYVSDTTYFSGFKNIPTAEIVTQVDAILNDADIHLVFVSSQQLEWVKPVIQAGKSVRII